MLDQNCFLIYTYYTNKTTQIDNADLEKEKTNHIRKHRDQVVEKLFEKGDWLTWTARESIINIWDVLCLLH